MSLLVKGNVPTDLTDDCTDLPVPPTVPPAVTVLILSDGGPCFFTNMVAEADDKLVRLVLLVSCDWLG